MTHNKQVIVIPYWVQETFARHQIPLAQALDFKTCQHVMSLSDVVSFAVAQQYFGQITGCKDCPPSSLYFTWNNSIPEDNQELREKMNNTVFSLEHDKSFHEDVKARLFDPQVKFARHEKPFIVMDLSSEVFGVVLYPGYFTEPVSAALQLQVIEAMLKVLYVYNTHDEVAKSPLFRRYLELLSKKQIIV